MAYVPRQIPKEQENQFGLNAETTPNPIAQSGGSTGTGSIASGGAAPGQGTSTQFGSNAAKLSDYLKANAPQVKEFGNEVAGNLTEGYNKALGSINQGYEQFGQQVNQGYATPDQEKINQAASNPTEFVKDPNNVSQFQSWFNNQYKGPQNFESSDTYSNVNRDVNKAVQDASMVNSEQGLGSYLRNNMNKGNLTPGMQTLNTALLQRSPEARTAIQNAAAPYSTLNEYLGGKTNAANQNVETAKNTTNQLRQDVQNRFTGEGGVVPTLRSGIDSRRGTQSAQATAELNAMNKFINKEALNTEEAQLLGLTTAQVETLRNKADQFSHTPELLNPWNNYFNATPNPSGVSMSSAATPEEFAQAQALSQLTGGQSFLNPDEANLSGSVPLDTTFDYETANSQLDDLIRRFGPRDPGTVGTSGTGVGFRAF